MPETIRRKPKAGNPNDPVGLNVLAGEHLEWMLIRNYSIKYINVQVYLIDYFIRWCEERGVTRPTEVSRAMLESYQRWLYHHRNPKTSKYMTTATQAGRLSAVKSLFKWLTRKNHILYNPASEIDLPRVGKRLPRAVLSPLEAEKVLSVPDTSKELGVRDRAILEVLYSTGIRRSELVNLKLYDIDRTMGTLMVRQGKGNKDRIIPIGSRALLWLTKYLHEVRPELEVGADDEGFIFLAAQGTPISSVSVGKMTREAIEAAEIDKAGSCHLFRHSMATSMLENGADIRFVQEMLGHADLGSTAIYTRVSIKQLRQVHQATHPANLPLNESEQDERETEQSKEKPELEKP